MKKIDSLDSGIYKIVNKINDMYYVGSSKKMTIGLNNRKETHFYLLSTNKHINPFLQHAWNKYGAESFEFVIIESGIPQEKLFEIEQSYLDKIEDRRNTCYNISFIANAPTMKGKKHSEETRKNMRKNHWNRGKRWSVEHRQKLSATRIERKIKNSEKQKGMQSEMVRGNNNYFHKNPLRGESHGCYDSTIFQFENRTTKEIFNGTKYNFMKKLNMASNDSGIYALIKGKRKSVKGWRIFIHNPELPQLPQSEASHRELNSDNAQSPFVLCNFFCF